MIGEAFLEVQISRLGYFDPCAFRPSRGDEIPRVVDSPIAEELGSAEEVEQLKQTFHLADTQLDPEPDLWRSWRAAARTSRALCRLRSCDDIYKCDWLGAEEATTSGRGLLAPSRRRLY